MAFPARTSTQAQTLRSVISTAASLRSTVQQLRDDSEVGAVERRRIVNLVRTLSVAIS